MADITGVADLQAQDAQFAGVGTVTRRNATCDGVEQLTVAGAGILAKPAGRVVQSVQTTLTVRAKAKAEVTRRE